MYVKSKSGLKKNISHTNIYIFFLFHTLRLAFKIDIASLDDLVARFFFDTVFWHLYLVIVTTGVENWNKIGIQSIKSTLPKHFMKIIMTFVLWKIANKFFVYFFFHILMAQHLFKETFSAHT